MSLERKTRALIAAIEGGASGEDLGSFYHADAIRQIYPSRMTPRGVQRDRAAIIEDAEASTQLMERQIYEVQTLTEIGDRVILECVWTGYPRTPVGAVRPGEPLHARVCEVIEYEDGLIIRQRSYACYDAF